MIGVFDSGIGGLTVLKALMESIPDYDFIYFGDTARAPYGSKSPKTVITCTLQNIEFLVNLGAKVVVLACHTVASLATDSVSARYDMPIFDVITPAVKHAIKTSRYQRIGIIGTRATTMSAAYEKKIHAENPNAKVYSAACPLLVPLIEESWHKKPETRMIVKKCLHPFKVRQIDTLILGCSYYGLLTRMIRTKIGKRVSLIDPSSCLADVVKAFLARHREVDELLGKNNYLRLILSDLTPQIEKLAGTILQRNVRIEAGGP